MKLVKVYKRSNSRYRNKLEERLLESRQTVGTFNRGSRTSLADEQSREDFLRQRRKSSYNIDDNDIEGTTNLVYYDRVARIYHTFSLTFLIIIAIKYIVAIVLENKALSKYRYIDCYLIGRASFTGSMIPLTKYWFLWVIALQLIWEVLMIFGKMKLKLDVLEFLLSDLVNVLAWDSLNDPNENRTSVSNKNRKSVQADLISCDTNELVRRKSRNPSTTIYDSYYTGQRYSKISGSNQEEPKLYTSISHFKAPYLHHGSDVYLLRPNRTAQVWITYQKYSFYYFMYIAVNTVIWLSSSGVMGLRGSATRRGFELSYNLCIDWIINKQSNKDESMVNQSDYSHIYTPHQEYSLDDPVESLIPLENLLTDSLYHKIRVGLSVFETVFIFFTSCAQFFAQFYICLAINVDTTSYIRCCKAKLALFTQSSYWNMENSNEMLSVNLSQAMKPVEDFANPVSNESHNQMSQIMELQASTYDLFNQIIRSNSYAAIFLPHLLLAWIYSGAISCFLQLAPGFNEKRGMMYESALMWAYFSVFVLIVLVNFAKVESYSRGLYRNLASAMAYDNSIFTTKTNWIILLGQYYPVPYYCYKVMGSTTVSYVFIIQVSCISDDFSLHIVSLETNSSFSSSSSQFGV